MWFDRLSSFPRSACLALCAVAASHLVMGCGGVTRNARDIVQLPRSAAKISVPVERPAVRVHAVVPVAASEMGLDVEEPSDGKRPWILHIGSRLESGPVFYRVDVEEVAGQPGCAVVVYAVPWSAALTDTDETLAKPGELAFRIVTLALGRQP